MVNLRSQKTTKRKVIIEESSPEQIDEEKVNVKTQRKGTKKQQKNERKAVTKIKKGKRDIHDDNDDDDDDEFKAEESEEENEIEDEVDEGEEENDEEEIVTLKPSKTKKPLKSKKIENKLKSNESNDAPIKTLEKGKRGYKRCKNESCNELIFIHQKVCPKCLHEHTMSKTSFDKKQKIKKGKTSSTFEILRAYAAHLTTASQGDLKIKKKDYLPIQQVKKNALYLDQFNLDLGSFQHMFEQGTKKLKTEDDHSANNSHNLSDNSAVDVKNQSGLDVTIKIEFQNEEYSKELKHFQNFTIYSKDGKMQAIQPAPTQVTEALPQTNQKQTKKNNQTKISEFLGAKKKPSAISSSQPETQVITTINTDWRMWVLNLGYPVTSVAWQYSSGSEQLLAVGLNLSAWESQPDKQTVIRTLSAYSLNHCHRIGQKYQANGCVLVFSLQHDKGINNYLQPTLKGSLGIIGSPIQVLWMPKFNGDKDINKDNDVIGVLSSDGGIHFYRYPFPQNEPISFEKCQQIQPILTVRIDEQVILSCFDWLNSVDCDLIVAGDQIGNIYLIEIGSQFKSFRVVQFYNNAHMGYVTDIKFYKQANQQEQILFASCGYDGILKIYDGLGSLFPLFRFESCLKSVKSIEWDIGGKYILVNRDKQSFSQIILSFFSTPISKEIKLNSFAEARQLQKLNQDHVVSNSCSSLYSQYVFSANENGLIFGNFGEQNRKIAVKKTKKKSSESEGFKVSTGSFQGSTREYNISLNDLSTIFLNKPSEELSDKKDKEQEIEDDIDDDKESNKETAKPKIEFKEIDNRSYVSSMDLSKGNIVNLGIKTQDNNQGTFSLESFLAHGNLGGILHITKIFS